LEFHFYIISTFGGALSQFLRSGRIFYSKSDENQGSILFVSGLQLKELLGGILQVWTMEECYLLEFNN